MIDYYPLQVGLESIEKDILLGKSFYESVEAVSIFDKKMASLIKVAEETNQNETIFKRITAQYHQEIEYKSKMISSTIEPLKAPETIYDAYVGKVSIIFLRARRMRI